MKNESHEEGMSRQELWIVRERHERVVGELKGEYTLPQLNATASTTTAPAHTNACSPAQPLLNPVSTMPQQVSTTLHCLLPSVTQHKCTLVLVITNAVVMNTEISTFIYITFLYLYCFQSLLVTNDSIP